MTTHARGALFLCPDTRSVVDIGALHARAMRINHRSRVLQYKMTGQGASGSGQFLENIVRYLGVDIQEIGALSRQAENPEIVSSICAVLAETDVINTVSRGISTPDILKGIHQSIANRLVQLLRAINAQSPVTITGGPPFGRAAAGAPGKNGKRQLGDENQLPTPFSVRRGYRGRPLGGLSPPEIIGCIATRSPSEKGTTTVAARDSCFRTAGGACSKCP